MADIEKNCVDLAVLANDSFKNRREYEWKVAFGLWTAIGIWTYFVIVNFDTIKSPSFSMIKVFVAYVILALVWLFLWQAPLRRAFEQDKCWKHYYTKKAVGEAAERPTHISYWDVFWRPTFIAWTYGQFLVTVIFLAGSFIAIDSTNNAYLAKYAKGMNGSTKAVQPQQGQRVPTSPSGSTGS